MAPTKYETTSSFVIPSRCLIFIQSIPVKYFSETGSATFWMFKDPNPMFNLGWTSHSGRGSKTTWSSYSIINCTTMYLCIYVMMYMNVMQIYTYYIYIYATLIPISSNCLVMLPSLYICTGHECFWPQGTAGWPIQSEAPQFAETRQREGPLELMWLLLPHSQSEKHKLFVPTNQNCQAPNALSFIWHVGTQGCWCHDMQSLAPVHCFSMTISGEVVLLDSSCPFGFALCIKNTFGI